MSRAQGMALGLYRRLPTSWRRRVVRRLSPSYTVGSMCMIERADGALLLVRHTYRSRWGVPGGLLERGEHPRDAAVRETLEETGLEIRLVGEPVVVVDPEPRRVDVVFSAKPAGTAPAVPSPCSAEIAEVAWFDPDELPELQHETVQALVALARSDQGSAA